MRETVNPTEEVYVKKLWVFNTKQRDHELKLHQIREHVKNTYLLKKLL